MSETRRYVGWFDSAEQETPAHDPLFTAPCIVCQRPMSEDDVRTVSLMWHRGSASLFYRMHRTCGESLTEREAALYDGCVLDAFAETMPAATPAGGTEP